MRWLIFVVVVLGAVIAIARVPLGAFFRAVREPFLIAFSTASSESALPLALENMEQFGVPKHIVAFVIPDRLQLQSGRQHAVSFAGLDVRGAGGRRADAVSAATAHDADPDADQQRRGGRAARRAGDSGGHAGHLRSAGGGLRILLGADALLDMARTSVNVLGNCLATRWWRAGKGYKVGVIAVPACWRGPARMLP